MPNRPPLKPPPSRESIVRALLSLVDAVRFEEDREAAAFLRRFVGIAEKYQRAGREILRLEKERRVTTADVKAACAFGLIENHFKCKPVTAEDLGHLAREVANKTGLDIQPVIPKALDWHKPAKSTASRSRRVISGATDRASAVVTAVTGIGKEPPKRLWRRYEKIREKFEKTLSGTKDEDALRLAIQVHLEAKSPRSSCGKHELEYFLDWLASAEPSLGKVILDWAARRQSKSQSC